jgi:hypothetical protein
MACGFNPSTSILAGLDAATLQTMLTNAQLALGKFATGQQEVTIIVTGGGQHREVTFARPDMGALTQWIKLLQAQLGIITQPRRAIPVSF